MIFSLEKKVAIITGGGSGIGRAIAESFSNQGATVCVVELNEQTAEDTDSAIKSKGGIAISIPCNVTDQQAMISAYQKVVEQFGRIDILVNSAGIANIGRLDNTSESDFDKVFQVNVKGAYNSMFAAIHQMKKQRKGVILNVASIAATLGVPDRFAYSMSKGAVYSMTLSVAKDYIKDGIRCNSISPARVHTPFVDGFIKANYPGK